MYEYRYTSDESLWTVGVVNPNTEWRPLRDCDSKEECWAFINYLNGGSGKPFFWGETE